MKIALCRKAEECTQPGLIQLRTPATGYARKEKIPWVMDNGSFSNFDESGFIRMALVGIADPNCKWIAMPDIVGDHGETLRLFSEYKKILEKHFIPKPDLTNKLAFVVQDGAKPSTIPWSEITAIFLGGTTEFKLSREAWKILEAAQAKKKWVHVGRVNTPPRICYFHGVATSIDGSGIAMFDHMLDDALDTIERLNKSTQMRLGDYLE